MHWLGLAMRCLIMHSFSAQKFLNKLSWVANFEALNSQSTALSYCKQAGRRQQTVQCAYTCSLVYCSARCSVSIRYKMQCKYISRRTEALALLACFKQTKEASRVSLQVCTSSNSRKKVQFSSAWEKLCWSQHSISRSHLAPSSACSTSRSRSKMGAILTASLKSRHHLHHPSLIGSSWLDLLEQILTYYLGKFHS